MLMLLFYAGKDAYAIDSQYIEEVFPRVNLKHIPQTPTYVAGLLNVRGNPIKTVDLTQLFQQRPSVVSFNTRIVLLKAMGLQDRHIAIIVEQAIEVIECSSEDFTDKGINVSGLPFLDGVMQQSGRTVRKFDVDKFFTFLEQSNAS